VVSGSTTAPDPTCGNVTWQIAGQQNPDGTFNLTESNPSPPVDACGQTVEASQTASVTILGCSQASETCTAGCNGGGETTQGARMRPAALRPRKRLAMAGTGSNTWTRTSNPPGLQVQVDLNGGKVTAVLSGANKTAPLTVQINGPQTTTLGQQGSAGPSIQPFSLQRTTLSPGQYSSVAATWDDLSVSVPISFKVLGPYRFSQYNVPTESACSGATAPAFVINTYTTGHNPACVFYPADLNSTFIGRTVLNGTGNSISFGLIKPWGTTWAAKYCPVPPLTGATENNTFVQVSSVTGSCNTALTPGTSVAVSPDPTSAPSDQLQCSDNVLLVDSSDNTNSIMVVGDTCPACSGGFNGQNGHIDVFSSLPTCQGSGDGAVVDYGNFTAIRTR